MQIIRTSDPRYRQRLETLNRTAAADPRLSKTVTSILSAVAKDGDRALIRLTRKFGGPQLASSQLFVSAAEVAQARRSVGREVLSAIRAAKRNVSAFAARSLRKSWFRKNAQGAIVGERFEPFERVGIYVPGGTAPLVSTAVMTCGIAQAAGVREIVAATPAGPEGSLHPALLVALAECGATEIYRVGGAQAIAGLAFGTATIRPVQKVFGPGNAYVVEAKRQVFGRVAVDLLPGPSEVLVIADSSARAPWVAADLLAQCEHGHGSAGILITDSAKLLLAVEKEIRRQVKLSGRPQALELGLAGTVLIEVPDMEIAVALANRYAAEHVSIATKEPGRISAGLTTAGAIFLGGITPVATGDFLAGPSHELPTGGAGKSFAGLTADQFQRRTSIVMMDEASLKASLPFIETFSKIEGLDAHARSAAIRLKSS